MQEGEGGGVMKGLCRGEGASVVQWKAAAVQWPVMRLPPPSRAIHPAAPLCLTCHTAAAEVPSSQ